VILAHHGSGQGSGSIGSFLAIWGKNYNSKKGVRNYLGR